uniref:Uncharacterized protein n=1 Tax=Corethron hystrix TaxID=216773 RepID=A0A7S1BYR2_9STRA|mmetsp:Transcript_5655/g.11863  ORF Transcript_5655/g.11863 Transcript_5655/m.11863 type:complete len:916 (+) Transcript_5655:42-2789(+)
MNSHHLYRRRRCRCPHSTILSSLVPHLFHLLILFRTVSGRSDYHDHRYPLATRSRRFHEWLHDGILVDGPAVVGTTSSTAATGTATSDNFDATTKGAGPHTKNGGPDPDTNRVPVDIDDPLTGWMQFPPPPSSSAEGRNARRLHHVHVESDLPPDGRSHDVASGPLRVSFVSPPHLYSYNAMAKLAVAVRRRMGGNVLIEILAPCTAAVSSENSIQEYVVDAHRNEQTLTCLSSEFGSDDDDADFSPCKFDERSRGSSSFRGRPNVADRAAFSREELSTLGILSTCAGYLDERQMRLFDRSIANVGGRRRRRNSGSGRKRRTPYFMDLKNGKNWNWRRLIFAENIIRQNNLYRKRKRARPSLMHLLRKKFGQYPWSGETDLVDYHSAMYDTVYESLHSHFFHFETRPDVVVVDRRSLAALDAASQMDIRTVVHNAEALLGFCDHGETMFGAGASRNVYGTGLFYHRYFHEPFMGVDLEETSSRWHDQAKRAVETAVEERFAEMHFDTFGYPICSDKNVDPQYFDDCDNVSYKFKLSSEKRGNLEVLHSDLENFLACSIEDDTQRCKKKRKRSSKSSMTRTLSVNSLTNRSVPVNILNECLSCSYHLIHHNDGIRGSSSSSPSWTRFLNVIGGIARKFELVSSVLSLEHLRQNRGIGPFEGRNGPDSLPGERMTISSGCDFDGVLDFFSVGSNGNPLSRCIGIIGSDPSSQETDELLSTAQSDNTAAPNIHPKNVYFDRDEPSLEKVLKTLPVQQTRNDSGNIPVKQILVIDFDSELSESSLNLLGLKEFATGLCTMLFFPSIANAGSLRVDTIVWFARSDAEYQLITAILYDQKYFIGRLIPISALSDHRSTSRLMKDVLHAQSFKTVLVSGCSRQRGGGGGGVTEAFRHGIPFLCVPFTNDQNIVASLTSNLLQ